MKPASHTKDASDKRKCIEESLEKMMDTKIRIDRSRGKIGFCFPDEEDSLILEGRFLPLEKEGKSSYRILETPPLYRYAELTNGQFLRYLGRFSVYGHRGKRCLILLKI